MNKKQILQDLSTFVSIPSVSADPTKKVQMEQAVSFLHKKLASMGCSVEIMRHRGSPPSIFAQYLIENAECTIGIYGHYDVQPEDPIEEWMVEPFVLTQKHGKYYGRGVADNKGHIIQNIAAVENLIASHSLKSNVIFFIEGEEECGSTQLEQQLIAKKKELKNVDVFFVTDVGMHAKYSPQIIYSLRGLAYFELKLKTGKIDLHSGVYGNAVLNPGQIVSDLVARMKNVHTGEVLVPGFYDDVRSIDPEEMAVLSKNVTPDSEFIQETGTFTLTSIKGVPAFLVPKIFPSLDVHGIDCGFVGEGPKTIIPYQARVKFSCRLVEYQNVKKIERLISDFIKNNLPEGVTYTLETFSYDNPFYTSLRDAYIRKTAKILQSHFGRETVMMREGGSIPAAEMIQRHYHIPVILTGFILPDSNLHAPNENFDSDMFWEGIEALQKIYAAF